MIVKQVKLTSRSKDKLSRLKAKTGIKNWNVLTRWALCYSLSEGTIPADVELEADSNVEMDWHTFGGEYSDVFELVLIQWCIEKGIDPSSENVAKYFKLHLERGISYLSGTNFIKEIDDLLELARR